MLCYVRVLGQLGTGSFRRNEPLLLCRLACHPPASAGLLALRLGTVSPLVNFLERDFRASSSLTES